MRREEGDHPGCRPTERLFLSVGERGLPLVTASVGRSFSQWIFVHCTYLSLSLFFILPSLPPLLKSENHNSASSLSLCVHLPYSMSISCSFSLSLIQKHENQRQHGNVVLNLSSCVFSLLLSFFFFDSLVISFVYCVVTLSHNYDEMR